MVVLNVYILVVSYNYENKILSLIAQYLNSIKPDDCNVKLIIIENSPIQSLDKLFDFSGHSDIYYSYSNNSNKASLINYCIQKFISEEEAIIILLDNDIVLKEDFIINYYNAAIQKGNSYYFGGALKVRMPYPIDEDIKPYLSISAKGKPDAAFLKQKNLMFLGCNYCVFKSQWKFVNGFDERFSAGSNYGLGADESVFQKKLMYVGYKPYFIKNNEVEHLIDFKLYDKRNVLERFKNNGYTHGFQSLITSQRFLKTDYMKQLIYLFKRFVFLMLKGEFFDAKFKYFYFLGFLKASFLYLKIENTTSYLDRLIKDSVKSDR